MAVLLKQTGLNWPELIRAIWRGSVEANVTNRAAELAFWFLLGFFPMLLSVTGLVSMISSAPGSQGTLMAYVGEVLPSAASRLVRQVLAQTTGSGRAWLSLLFALWSSSSATSGLIDTLNSIYGVKERRPWWKSRLIAVGLAIALGVLLTAALIILVYGPLVMDKILPWLGSPLYLEDCAVAGRRVAINSGAPGPLPLRTESSGTKVDVGAAGQRGWGCDLDGGFRAV